MNFYPAKKLRPQAFEIRIPEVESLRKKGEDFDSLLGELRAVKESIDYLNELKKTENKIDKSVGSLHELLTKAVSDVQSIIYQIVVLAQEKLSGLPSTEELLAYIPIPKDGKDGQDGKDGTTPDLDVVAKEVLSKIDLPTKEELEDTLKQLVSKKKLTVKDIDGIDEYIASIRRAVMLGGNVRGGGDTVAAGSGVTITTSNGVKTINAAGGVSVETPTGTVDGSNTVFTVSNAPVFIVVDGVNKYETLHYTYVAGTITITDGAPPVQFIRSHY